MLFATLIIVYRWIHVETPSTKFRNSLLKKTHCNVIYTLFEWTYHKWFKLFQTRVTKFMFNLFPKKKEFVFNFLMACEYI